MDVGIEFAWILDVAPNEIGIGIDLKNFFFCIKESLLWIGFAKVIVLYRGSKYDIFFLSQRKNTFFESWAVISMIFCLDVTEVK